MVEWWLEERHRARSFGVAFNYSYVSNYVSATVKVYPAKEVSTYVCMYTLAYVRGMRVCGALRRYWLVYMHVKVEYFHLLHTLKLLATIWESSGISYQLSFFKILCQFQGRCYILLKLNERNPSRRIYEDVHTHVHTCDVIKYSTSVCEAALPSALSAKPTLSDTSSNTIYSWVFSERERERELYYIHIYGSLLITQLFHWYSEQKRIKFVSVELPLQFQKTILQIASVSSHLLQQRPRQKAVNRSSNMQIIIKNS